MLGKKKGFTASQSKRMSRRMQSSTIGTHVQRPASSRGRHASSRSGEPRGASHVDFANGRRSGAVDRGFVSHVGAATTSAEDDGAYSRRTSRAGYVQEIQRRARRRRILFIAVAALVVAVIAVVVGVATYFGASDSKLSLENSNAAEALVAAEDGAPSYVLCAAQLDSAKGSSSDSYLLARLDTSAKTISLVAIPGNLDVKLSDGMSHPLSDARSVGGDAELIRAVSSFADVDIAHFVTTDDEGIAGMVDAVGGVTLTLSEEVDDPRAGTIVLSAGEQTLDGAAAQVLLRATNYTGGIETASSNRMAFTLALVQKALSTEGLDFAGLVGSAGSYLSTDMTSSQIMSAGDALRPFDQVTVYQCMVPGYESDGDDPRFVSYSSEWASMLERLKAGQDPNEVDSSSASVNPADVSVEVRNGANSTGAAARMGEMLQAAGYVVDGVGNVDDGTTYPETLVIYKQPENEGAAKAVVGVVDGGRVVNGGDFYTFSTDVLVIIGQDWMPLA